MESGRGGDIGRTDALIRGERIWLRGFEERDLAPYSRFVNSADALVAGYALPRGERAIRESYDWIGAHHGKDGYFFVISPVGSDEFAGSVWLWNIDGRLKDAELSIFISERTRWGTGLGTDAVNAVLDFAFGYRDLERIWLFTDADNERAQRAFQKSGFVQEGVLRRHIRRKGDRIDSVLMAVLREEWEELPRRRSWDYLA